MYRANFKNKLGSNRLETSTQGLKVRTRLKSYFVKLIQKFSEPLSIRWFIVGVTSLVIDVYGFTLGSEITESIFVANFIATALSSCFNYLAHYFWTFNSKDSHIRTILRYYMNIFLIWIMSSLLIKLLILNGLDSLVAKILSLVLILPSNFLTLKFFVYK